MTRVGERQTSECGDENEGGKCLRDECFAGRKGLSGVKLEVR